MKKETARILEEAIASFLSDTGSPPDLVPEIQVLNSKAPQHGDFSTNAAMILASKTGRKPREVAGEIAGRIAVGGGLVSKVEIAGPGYINFFLDRDKVLAALGSIEAAGPEFGRSELGNRRRVQVEFVSANPTGPLHIGHGRNAATGDALARLLRFAGYQVQTEYYVNDAGNQIQTLGKSILLRYRQLLGEDVEVPEGHYVGDYIIDVARALRAERGDGLGEDDIEAISRFGADRILAGIQTDLRDFRVQIDEYFSEQRLYEDEMVDRCLDELEKEGRIYREEGARWFRTTDYGDEKDRVVMKSDGEKTYFASDIAYHRNKFERGFDRVIDIWGADHHGYVARVKAAVQAMGRDPDDFHALLIQMVNLIRDGEMVSMSSRAGRFVTLREIMDEVGADAARFIFLTRRGDSQLDFDVDLAKRQSSENPVYYVQYMHARICSIFRVAAEKGIAVPGFDEVDPGRLELPEEVEIAKQLLLFPEIVEQSAQALETHRIPTYLQDLASRFHAYYYNHRVLSDDAGLTGARLFLSKAARNVVANGLGLLGVQAPERM